MKNLVDAEPERASQMAYALHSWVQSLPNGPSWMPNPGCQGFRFPTGESSSFGTRTIADLQVTLGVVGAEAEGQDSAPDW